MGLEGHVRQILFLRVGDIRGVFTSKKTPESERLVAKLLPEPATIARNNTGTLVNFLLVRKSNSRVLGPMSQDDGGTQNEEDLA